MVTGSAIGRTSAQCEYTIAHVLPDGPLCNGKPYAPNIQAIADDGSVCGFAGAGVFCPDRPFIWHPGDAQLTFLPFAPGTASGQAYDLNQGKVVVGMCRNASDTQLPCRWINGVASLLPMPAGFTTGVAAAVNASGMIAGYVGNGVIFHAVTWTDGAVQDLHLSVPNGYGTSRAADINDDASVAGVVAGISGTRAALWTREQVVVLPAFAGTTSQANAVNVCDEVVGRGPFSPRSFLWRAGLMIDLGMLVGFQVTDIVDINDAGRGVGWCESVTGIQAVVWQDWVLSPILVVGEPLHLGPTGINNAGQVVAARTIYSPVPRPPFDIDANCAIDINDLLSVLNSWGQGGGPADCTQDGIVDWNDLMLVIVNWG